MFTLLRKRALMILKMRYNTRKQEHKIQYFDQPQILENKINQLVQIISQSNHMIAFTGAGISTSTGIPDYRSGKDTILSTGPGAWEMKALGMNTKNIYAQTTKAKPSLTHMALIALQKHNILKFLVSQNTDGLHLRSGFPSQFISQLHGNLNLQICKSCSSKFLRDYRTRIVNHPFDHETKRNCEKCSGKLYDSIINFGEQLPRDSLQQALFNAQHSDVCLTLGSSLTVNPAAKIPALSSKKGKLIIVNLQSTPLDKYATLKINAMCDDVMQKTMSKLQIPIPKFILKRYIQLKKIKNNLIQIRGIDQSGAPFSFLKDIISNNKNITLNSRQQFQIPTWQDKQRCNIIDISLVFYGHYNEKPYNIRLKTQDLNQVQTYQLKYDVYKQKWIDMTYHRIN